MWRVFWVPQDTMRTGVRRRVQRRAHDRRPRHRGRRPPQRAHPAPHRPEEWVLPAHQGKGADNEHEARLRATIARLKKTIAAKNKELAQLRADVPALVRAVNQLTLENLQLPDMRAAGGTVVTFPGRAPARPRDWPPGRRPRKARPLDAADAIELAEMLELPTRRLPDALRGSHMATQTIAFTMCDPRPHAWEL